MNEFTPILFEAPVDAPSKTCTKCKTVLPLSAFTTKKGTDKWYSWCRRCTTAVSREIMERRRRSRPGYAAPVHFGPTEDHECVRCGEFKSYDKFKLSKRGNTRQRVCKECSKQPERMRYRQRMQQNPNYRPIVPIRDGQKLCNRCLEWKPLEQYRTSRHGRPYCPCIDCCKRINAERIVLRYGLAAGSYERMYEEQNGRCAICGCQANLFENRLSIDHCHKRTVNSVRGLLCKKCNQGLGLFNDDIARLRAAVRYLKAAQQRHDAIKEPD